MSTATSSTLPPSERKLSEVARHLIIPEGITTSVFPRVYRRLSDVGVSFDRWQQGFGTVALGCRATGKYAATVGGVVAPWPRQVGKTYTVGNLVIGGCLEFPGLRVIWTSHHNRTTTNTFRSMQAMVRRKKIWPHVHAIRTANGEQEIVFTNGSIIMFGAREQGFGRGMDAIDWEVFDEAQILGLKALEDMVPATNAAKHPHGGLVFFLGTPPRPGDDGEAFTVKRKKALDGLTTDQVYCEISADPDTNPDDQSQFGTFNPSYPHRTPLEAMLRMRENIPDVASWRREAMGIWDEGGSHTAVVTRTQWADRKALGPVEGVRPDGFGADMSHDRQVSIGACWVMDTVSHLEEVWAHFDTEAAVQWLVDNAGRKPVVIDSLSPAAALIPALKARRVNVSQSSASDMAKACGLLVDKTNSETLTHGGQQQIDDALQGAKKRDIRDAGGWGWDRSDPTQPIYPVVAVTLALLAAESAKRKRKSTGRTVIMR